MLETPSSTPYTVRVYLNTDPDSSFGYQPQHRVCTAPDLIFTVHDRTAAGAAEAVWTIGNRMGADTLGDRWPGDVRSMMVGDVVAVRDVYDRVRYFGCAAVGFDELWPGTGDDLALHTTAIEGQERVSSR